MTAFKFRTAFACSVSIFALAACSQPASYAVVDLSGSYSDYVAYAPPAYSQPVYESVSVYGGAPIYDPPGSVVYAAPPVNQVASIDYTYTPIPTPLAAPIQSAPIASAPLPPPLFADEILAPGSPYAAAPPVYAPIETPGAISAPLQSIPQQPLIGPDYTSISQQPFEIVPAPGEPVVTSAPKDPVFVPPQTAALPQAAVQPPPFVAPTIQQPVGTYARPYEALRPGVFPRDLAGEASAALPTPLEPSVVTNSPATPLQTAQEISNILAPAASAAQGGFEIVPMVDMNAGGAPLAPIALAIDPASPAEDAPIYDAPIFAEQPAEAPRDLLLASVMQSPIVPQVSTTATHTVIGGDTLYSISQRYDVTPVELARANDITLSTTIYPGMALIVPALTAPVAEPLNLLPISETFTPQDAKVAASIIEPEAVPNFVWPVDGDVYRYPSGPIEIAPASAGMVIAPERGRVARIENGARGVLIVIDHLDGYESVVRGLDAVLVATGDDVAQGATLGVTSGLHRVLFDLRDDKRSVDTLAMLGR